MGPVSETDPDEPTPVLVEDEAPEEASNYQRFDCTDTTADQSPATDAARKAIEAGECIVLPTDTVYGIGADAFSPDAVQRLLDAKGRGRDMPPPVLIGESSLIRALATDVPEAAKQLVNKHWPGALTVICKIQPSLRMDLGETGGTIALRTRHAVECGELALLSNEYTFSAPGYEASWTTSEVARRQPDGSWRYVIDNPYAAPVTS